MTSLNASLNTVAPTMQPRTRFSSNRTAQPRFSADPQPQQQEPARQRSLTRRLLVPVLALGTLIGGGAWIYNDIKQMMFEDRCARITEAMPHAEVTCDPKTRGIIVDITPKEFRTPE